ncbi:MAG TPA: metallophosphoesterase family protein [Kofleriaceae bacterium]|jgi:serine/threonine protein phosphatase 1
MRTLVIGDIHGCYRELLDLLDVAAVAADDIVVSVGDLVDRGPESAEVVAWFRARANAVVLMGNHERKHVRGVMSYSQEVTRVQLGASYASDVAWMRTLPYFYETPELRVVHAALVPGVPLAQQDEAILAGTTSGTAALEQLVPGRWWHEAYDDAIPVAFGHHVVGPEPLVRDGKIYGLDTGACHGMRLTALSVPDFKIYSVPARADHWHAVARRHQLAVLRKRPWATYGWAKLAEAIAAGRAHASPDAHAYLDAIERWAAELRALAETLLARVAELAPSVVDPSTHPAKPLLYKHARGTLVAADIASRCSSPETTIALADKLGVHASAMPDVASHS